MTINDNIEICCEKGKIIIKNNEAIVKSLPFNFKEFSTLTFQSKN